jgi:hypothetical protein
VREGQVRGVGREYEKPTRIKCGFVVGYLLKKKKEIKGEYLRVSSPSLRVKENLPSRLLRYLRHPRLNRGEAPISIWRAEQGRGGDPV